MGDLTLNVSRKEVACNCGCGFDTIDWLTLTLIQELCDHFAEKIGAKKVTLFVNSGCRCFAWNDYVNGSENSQHLYGRALDFSIKEVKGHTVWEYLNDKYNDKYGLSEYPGFIHFDTRTGHKARW